MPRVSKVVLFGVLFLTGLMEAIVLYSVEDQNIRLYAGMALFVVVGWVLSSKPISETLGGLPDQAKQRRYPRMRSQVKLLLEEVKRLNWMAVDGHRGFRNQEEAETEMDAIENRMKDLVEQIRREAGITNPDSASVADQPPADRPAPSKPAPE